MILTCKDRGPGQGNKAEEKKKNETFKTLLAAWLGAQTYNVFLKKHPISTAQAQICLCLGSGLICDLLWVHMWHSTLFESWLIYIGYQGI